VAGSRRRKSARTVPRDVRYRSRKIDMGLLGWSIWDVRLMKATVERRPTDFGWAHCGVLPLSLGGLPC
jgi:hypothetical protein